MKDPRALTLWPEWCPAFSGVRLANGVPSQLDKGVENRPMAPWATIEPRTALGIIKPGRWFAMHAGAHIGGRPGNEGALGDVVETARAAGWAAQVVPGGADGTIRLTRGERSTDLRPEIIVRSAIVALIRVTAVQAPGEGAGEPWRFADRFGWRLDVRALATPIPCRGAQGLWRVPDAVAEAIRAQVTS